MLYENKGLQSAVTRQRHERSCWNETTYQDDAFWEDNELLAWLNSAGAVQLQGSACSHMLIAYKL